MGRGFGSVRIWWVNGIDLRLVSSPHLEEQPSELLKRNPTSKPEADETEAAAPPCPDSRSACVVTHREWPFDVLAAIGLEFTSFQ